MSTCLCLENRRFEMRNYEYNMIPINELCVNPENYRYVNDASDEIDAIICMFNIVTGTPQKEMLNLSRDIVEDGLNPFEMPIVCFDEDLKKYIVYEGNRRITCIKLMTQYKNNNIVLEKVPIVSEIYKLECNLNEIQCVVYSNSDDAKHFLYKIHQDVNGGIGRKQWDSQAKMKAEAAIGNKSKAYSIVEFLKENPKTDTALVESMDTNRWISKLERVVGFAKFKEAYNITFNSNNSIIYRDSEEQVLFMLSKLVSDLISNSATDNFRFKKDFDNYIDNLSDEFKTQIKDTSINATQPVTYVSVNDESDKNSKKEKKESVKELNKENDTCNGNESSTSELPATGEPRRLSKKTIVEKAALQLGKNYLDTDYDCLNEKGKQILMELESLNIKEYPFASAALSRAMLECVLKLWIDTEVEVEFCSSSLPSTYNGCINALRNKRIIDNKEHTVLKAQINKEDYITLLNTWIHSDTSACVSESNLISGWKNTRLLIEKYIDTHK